MRRLPMLLCALLWSPSSHAGAWVRDAGSHYLQVGGALYQGQPGFVSDIGVDADFRSLAGEGYGELGLGAGLELNASTRWVDNVRSLPERDRHNQGLEDVEVRLKWALPKQTHPVSVLVGTRFATYERLGAGPVGRGVPQLGSGGRDVLAGISLGRSFHPEPYWVTMDALMRVRLNGPGSGPFAAGELGTRIAGPLGGALTATVQPIYGRNAELRERDPAPVAKALGAGAKSFVSLPGGLGLQVDTVWLPAGINDGPGFRVGAAIFHQRSD